MAKGASVSDVAKLAGVSTATVSRALRFPDKVSPAMLARVQHAAECLHYVVDGAARALRSRHTYMVGALIPSLDNAFFARATNVLQRELAEKNYSLVLACYEFDLKLEAALAKTLVERGVDGLVLFGLDHEPELVALMDRLEIPYLFGWSIDTTGRYPCVGMDNRKATARLTAYLWGLGHREFAIISGVTDQNDRARERVAGVLQVLESHGVTLPPSRLLQVPYTVRDGAQAMSTLLHHAERPTAVVCVNDILAIGALSQCRIDGVAVPAAISIAGYGDMEIAAFQEPSLTTLRTPTLELGRTMARHMLGRLAGQTVPWQTELPVELIERGSTARRRR